MLAEVVVSDERLVELGQEILTLVGTPPEAASAVARSLVESNLTGHDSHGVLRLPSYVEMVRQGQVRPAERPEVRSRRGAVARIDGKWGWGQLAARLATDHAIALARDHGVGLCVIANCNHIGRLGEYVELIGRRGMIGHALCNTDPAVAAPGGRIRLMGTNPIAWALPADDDGNALVLDFATAAIAEGKLRLARAKDVCVEPGALVDRLGNESQNPAAFYEGGALLPFGGHKGYGMSVVIELIGRALADTDVSPTGAPRGGFGTLVAAIDVAAVTPLHDFTSEVIAWCSRARISATADDDGSVTLPGDPEREAYAWRSREGIPLPSETLTELEALREELRRDQDQIGLEPDRECERGELRL